MKFPIRYRLSWLFLFMIVFAFAAQLYRRNLTSQREFAAAVWCRQTQRVATLLATMRPPSAEIALLLQLMEQNPGHSLWNLLNLNSFQQQRGPYWDAVSFFGNVPRYVLRMEEKTILIFASRYPCDSRIIFVSFDSSGRIHDVQQHSGVYNVDPLQIEILDQEIQPCVKVNCPKRFFAHLPSFEHVFQLEAPSMTARKFTICQISKLW